MNSTSRPAFLLVVGRSMAWRRRLPSASCSRACLNRRVRHHQRSSSWLTPPSTACCSSAWPRASITSSRGNRSIPAHRRQRDGDAHGGRTARHGRALSPARPIGAWLTPELADYVVPLGLFSDVHAGPTVLEIVMVSRHHHLTAAVTYGTRTSSARCYSSSGADVRHAPGGVHRCDGLRRRAADRHRRHHGT